MSTTRLLRIEVEAFRNFAKAASLDVGALPVGLHMVRGRNLVNPQIASEGAGKSTFFSDAPSWCLGGQTAGGLRTTDVRSWLSKRRPRVALTLARDGEEHVVQRGPRATDLSIDGRTVGQDAVDALDGLSHAIRCQAIFMGQGLPLFLDLSPRDKMQVLSDALGLERWERRAQAAGTRARRLDERGGALEGELRGMETARDQARSALERAQGEAQLWGREQGVRLEEAASAARSARGRAEELEAKREQLSFAADSAGTNARLLAPAAEEARAELARLRAELRGAGGEVATARRALERDEAGLASFAEAGECPTCGQPVSKKNADAHARELRAQVAAHRRQIAKLEKEEGGRRARISALEDRLAEEEPRLRELEAAEAEADSALRQLDRSIGEARARADAAERELARAEQEENPHRQAAQAARRDLRALAGEIREKEELLGRLRASSERAQFWSRGFRDIRLGVIDDVVAEMQEATAEVLDGLGLGEWRVDYATERETKSGSTQRALAALVSSPAAPEAVRWEVYSGGERQRVRLAAALALSEVLLARAGADVDFRVLDEPTRGLSPEGRRDLAEVLGEYAERAGLKIFLIDHTVAEGSVFQSTLLVEGGPRGATLSARES